jgi:hypothetical protein
MTNPHQKAAQMLAASAEFLDQGQPVNRLSITLTAIGLGVLLIPMVPASEATQPTAALVVLLGLVELYFSSRVAIAAAQFKRLAEDALAARLDIAGFDAALVSLKLSSVKQASRPVGRRLDLARRFLFAQVAFFVLQVAVALAGSLLVYFSAI